MLELLKLPRSASARGSPVALTATVVLALLAALAPPRAWAAQAAAGAEAAPATAKPKRPSRAGTRAELQSVRAQIQRMRQQASTEARERGRLTTALRAVELALEKSGAELERINDQIRDYDARRAANTAAQLQGDRALAAARAQLASGLRGAYMLSRGASSEAWLSAGSAAQSARLLSYYRYVSQASAAHITQLSAQVRQLGGLAQQLAQQQAELATLKQSQEETQQQLSQQRDQRQRLLQQLGASARTRTERLARLTSEQSELERVLRQLGRSAPAAAASPRGAGPDLTTAFGRRRGQLAWPVQGQISAQFGQERASGVTWDGMLIATQRDSPVHAVSAGKVVYADWLPGLGLLVIIDHGDGYLSLYGHNDRLLKAVGSEVGAGEVIAAAGDTGGRAEPELYFEIRRAGKPIDPRPWFQTPQPTPP